MLTYGSLFTGIGGIDLGLDRAGWECRWQVESNPHAAAVLAQHWPHVARHGDIRAVRELPVVDLVCGGFPCQPTSVAGNRRGSADERWLWPEFARILGLVRPTWALLENPPGLLSFREFGDVLGDLASLGFDAEWDSFPAAAFGAPHIRDRVFVVAYSFRNELRNQPGRLRPERSAWLVEERKGAALTRNYGPTQSLADPEGVSGQLRPAEGERSGRSTGGREALANARREPSQVPAPRLVTAEQVAQWARWWEVEPDMGRVADGVPNRLDRLTRLGNAVVPQVAEFIGRCIAEVA